VPAATNQMAEGVASSRTALPPAVRYARAFNTLGGENMADPMFDDGPADMFFSAPEADRETVIEGVGLRPAYVGPRRGGDHRLPFPPVGGSGREAGSGTTSRPPPARGSFRAVTLRIRQEHPEDHEEVARLVRRAFGGRGNEPALVARLRRQPGYRPAFALVAEEGGVLVGHALLSTVELVDTAGVAAPILVLAPVSVLPQAQGRGVGSALVNRLIVLAGEAGETLVVVLGDPRYYGRFGFARAALTGIHPPDGVPAEAFSVKRLAEDTPPKKGTVRFPAVFAETGTL